MVTSPSSSLNNGNYEDDQEEPLLDRLRRRALQYVRPSRRERMLIRMLARTRSMPINSPYPLNPPTAFREVLRRPRGGQHHLVVDIGGRPHGLVLNAQGIIDPDREDYLWQWLITRVQKRGTE